MIGRLLFIYFALQMAFAIGEESSFLTLEKAWRIALNDSPMIKAAEEGVLLYEEEIKIKEGSFLPEINAFTTATRLRLELPRRQIRFLNQFPGKVSTVFGPVTLYGYGVIGKYLLFDSGKSAAQTKQALAKREIAQEQRQKTQQDLLLQVSASYFEVMANLEHVQAAHETLLRAQNHRRIALERKAAGAVPLVDVLRAESEVAQAQLALIQAESATEVSKGNLNVAMGLSPDLQIELEVVMEEIAGLEDFQLGQALKNAELYRPEIKIRQQEIFQSQNQVAEAKSAFGPKVTTEGMYSQFGDRLPAHDKEWLVGINVEMSLFRGFKDLHRVRQAKHAVAQGEANLSQQLLLVRQDVWQAYIDLKEHYQTIVSSKAEVRSAKEAARLSEERYQNGAGTLTDLLDAQNTLSQARTRFISAKWNYRYTQQKFCWSQGILFVDGFM